MQIYIDPNIARAKYQEIIPKLITLEEVSQREIDGFDWKDAADSIKHHNNEILKDCGFIRDSEKRWIPDSEWKSVDDTPPVGVNLMVFRQAYGIGNPTHPGFGTDAWIEKSTYLEFPWRGFACTLISNGFATHWMLMPANESSQSSQATKQWKHIKIIGARIGDHHYCQWSEILKSPVSDVMELADFQEYVLDECGFSPDIINELPAWIEYIQTNGISDKSMGNVVANNGAGFEGERLSIQQLIKEYAPK